MDSTAWHGLEISEDQFVARRIPILARRVHNSHVRRPAHRRPNGSRERQVEGVGEVGVAGEDDVTGAHGLVS